MEAVNAIGRRKAAVARVYLTEGSGKDYDSITRSGKLFPLFYPSVRGEATIEYVECIGKIRYPYQP